MYMTDTTDIVAAATGESSDQLVVPAREEHLTPKPEPPEPPPAPPQQKKINPSLVLSIVLFLALALPLSVYFVNQQQRLAELRSRADELNPGPEGGLYPSRDCTYQDTGCESGFHAAGTYPNCRCEPDETPKPLLDCVTYCTRVEQEDKATCQKKCGESTTTPISCMTYQTKVEQKTEAEARVICNPSSPGPGPGPGGPGPSGPGPGSSTTGTPSPTQPPVAQCSRLKIYKDGQEVTDPTTLKPDDQVKFGIAGTGATKGRFRVNSSNWTETTTKNASDEYELDFTIPKDTTNFTVEGEVFINGQWV